MNHPTRSPIEVAARGLFDALPPRARRRLRSLAGKPSEREIPLPELDRELEIASQLFQESQEKALSYLARIRLAVPAGQPPDAFSPAYRDWTWEIYRRISGTSQYVLANERSKLGSEDGNVPPYPYRTGSPTIVGEELEARGHVLRRLAREGAQAQPPARLVEFGPGWGNLTIDLALTGYRVTAVDADPDFCDLLIKRAAGTSGLQVCEGDMLTFEPESRFDVAVFFESFHHCADHTAMLHNLHDLLVSDGIVIFAGEPVHEMPYPWGPRLDGLSLWSTRRYGWLELGFRPAYFRAALAECGWDVTFHRLRRVGGKADIYVARRRDRCLDRT
jgi:SAM-dependent methyltransferase